MKNQGEKLLKEKSQKNEKMEPLSNFPEAPTKVFSVYAPDLPRKPWETFLYRITYNGHFWPEKLLKKETVPVAYDWYYSPHRYFFRRRLLAVNPHLKMVHTEKWTRRDFSSCSAENVNFSAVTIRFTFVWKKNTETTEKSSLQKVSGENIWR